jgi:prepilin-type N-terminal cleavage/methylation domain-containing protein/prepilin-type processing-associated H-X9-DG protein
MRPTSLKPAAFTLVELLVVIAIIGVLVSLIMPAFSKVREHSLQLKCSAVIRGISTACLIYDQDYKAFPNGNATGEPYQINSEDFSTTAGSGTHITLRDSYGVAPNATVCPNAPTTTNNGGTINYAASWAANSYAAGTSYYYLCGNGGWADSTATINGWARSNFDAYRAGFYPASSAIKPYKLYIGHRITPSQQFMMLDYNGGSTGGSRPNRANHPGLNATKVEGLNVSFMDGHAEWQVIKKGVSWAVYGAGATSWWTPSFPNPTAPSMTLTFAP